MAKKKPVSPPSPETREHLLSLFAATTEPITASQASKLLTGPHKLKEAEALPILDEFVAAAKLQTFPPKTAKGKPRYWDRGINELARLMILATVEKKGALAKADLRKATKQVPEAAFETAFQGLTQTRTLFEHPPLGKKKTPSYGKLPPSPDAYLKDLGAQLTKLVAQLIVARVPEAELRRALVQLVEATGVPFGGAAKPPAAASLPESTVDLVSLIKRIEPAAMNGALVAARELRRAANLVKSQFDAAVLDLARQGRLMLHRHDFAGGLEPAEREELVTDGAGTYYVGVALRREQV